MVPDQYHLLPDFPADLLDYYVNFAFLHPQDVNVADPEVAKIWDEFTEWYSSWSERIQELRPQLTVRALGEELLIMDSREGGPQFIQLKGTEARIYDLCHRPSRLDSIASAVGRSGEATHEMLNALVGRRLMFESNGKYLSLAIRLDLDEEISLLNRPSSHSEMPGAEVSVAFSS